MLKLPSCTIYYIIFWVYTKFCTLSSNLFYYFWDILYSDKKEKLFIKIIFYCYFSYILTRDFLYKVYIWKIRVLWNSWYDNIIFINWLLVSRNFNFYYF